MKDPHVRLIAFLSVGSLAMLAATLAMLVFVEVPKANEQTINLLIGAIIGQATAVISYHFGKTRGEAQSTETIGRLIENQPRPNTPMTAPPGSTITAQTSVQVPPAPESDQ